MFCKIAAPKKFAKPTTKKKHLQWNAIYDKAADINEKIY